MNPRDALKIGQETFLKSLDGLSDQDVETGFVIDEQNVKNVVIHILALERVLEEVISSQLSSERPEEIPHLVQFKDMSIDEFNSFHWEEKKFVPYTEILAELNSSHHHLTGVMYLITDDMMNEHGIIPWFSERYSLGDFIINVIYKSKIDYSNLIQEFKKRLERSKRQPTKPVL